MIDNDTNKPKMRGNRRVICHVSDISEAGKGLSLNNIIIADVGTQIQLSKLPFGAEISHFGKATDSEIFHLERETMLVNDFGSIISALLMGDPKSGRKSSAKRRRNRDS